jgi:hypothetical protein
MKQAFQDFFARHPYLTLEQSVEFFSIFGGLDAAFPLDLLEETADVVHKHCTEDFARLEESIRPSYLLDTPYKALLTAIAKGDGKYHKALRKAKLSEEVGQNIVNALVELDVLYVENSRETPLRQHPKHKLPKSQRKYKIQDKLRFKKPFLRFWFAFVVGNEEALSQGEGDVFFTHFKQHYERLRSLVYEQLSDALLREYYSKKDAIETSGSYWNIYSEFDILAVSKRKKVILGECKYKERSVCKNELTKLKLKAKESGIAVDVYALFSKSGFSKELQSMKSDTLLLFDLNDLEVLL